MIKSLILKLELRQIIRDKKREIAKKHFESAALLLDREKAIRKKLGMANTSTTTMKKLHRWEIVLKRFSLKMKKYKMKAQLSSLYRREQLAIKQLKYDLASRIRNQKVALWSQIETVEKQLLHNKS